MQLITNKDGIPFDIDAIITDLNGKADTDLLNVSDTGNVQMAKASMPSNKYVNLTLGASGTHYTAPANGWFLLRKDSTGVHQELRLTNISNQLVGYTVATGNLALGASVPVKKGDQVDVYYSAEGTLEFFRFIYAVGSENEVS